MHGRHSQDAAGYTDYWFKARSVLICGFRRACLAVRPDGAGQTNQGWPGYTSERRTIYHRILLA